MKTAWLYWMIGCYQNKKAILIYFLQEDDIRRLIYTTYLKAFLIYQKNTIHNNSKRIILFKQTLRDIIPFVFEDKTVLDMNLEEWKSLCRQAWENGYECSQVDRFAKIGEGRYTVKNFTKITYMECNPKTKPF